MKEVEKFCEEYSWSIVHTHKTEVKEKELFDYKDLNLTDATLNYLSKFAAAGIYKHQREAIRFYLQGENVCLSTGTASGKSLPFYAAGIETLSRDTNAKVIAVYPIKALGVEQEERWKSALIQANLDAKVGRIDGQVNTNERKKILQECRVLIMTPDVMHAWLLSNLSDNVCVKFIRTVKLIIVDEVHTYTGVFGSNAAFLFRRLRHLMGLCKNQAQFFSASATIADPSAHLENLFGLPFTLINSSYDTSPKYGMDIIMLNPPKSADLLTESAKFLKFVANKHGRFLCFVDSRKQTELLASIISRGQSPDEEETGIAHNHLETLQILPYRAGYEELDRTVIQRRLSSSRLEGVISTSALELGLDIPNLEVAVLLGVPYSATSFFQRIGRIGRHKRGIVFIVNTGGFYDELVFKNPEKLMERPLIQSTLYLENQRVQYIHALCLARHGGENDQMLLKVATQREDEEFKSEVIWPNGFLEICHAERIGAIPAELQAMKAEAGDDPNHVFPLRDVESQFRVELKQGPEQRDLGQLSFSQVMREAYPGAVYYYATSAFRVYRVSPQSKTIQVRKERRYSSTPVRYPTLVFPNLTEGNVYHSRKHDNLIVFESNLQIRESLAGYKERRGPTESTFTYPLNAVITNIFYQNPRFTRNYFTSGVVFTHPAFNRENVLLESIGKLIYEAFLICIPFERQDIDFAIDKHRTNQSEFFNEGKKFIAVYDRTYGSLRLSGHIMEQNRMAAVIEQAIEIASLDETIEINSETLEVLEELYKDTRSLGMDINFFKENTLPDPSTDSMEKIILPGSKGLAVHNGTQEYSVLDIFFNPKLGGLCYRGRFLTQGNHDTTTIILPISSVVEIPGESEIGFYDYESGETRTQIPLDNISPLLN